MRVIPPADVEEASDAEVAAASRITEPRALVAWALGRFPRGRVALVTGLQAPGVAVLDMALEVDPAVRVVTVDTGRLPEETHGYIDTLRERYGCRIEVVLPDPEPVEALTAALGVNAFRRSVQARLDCCHHRKVAPMERVLDGLDCWMTGLQRSQSAGRAATPTVQRDHRHGGIIKVNPLAGWTEADAHAYLAARGVPGHPLYAKGYRSIGCAPCTRAVAEGEDARAGRWWWETGVEKECGIHGPPDRLAAGGAA